MNNYDKLLISYTDVHSYKEYAHEPFLQGEFAYATNGQSCIQDEEFARIVYDEEVDAMTKKLQATERK